ncbi:hypothetical protein [Krasilnikovia sp. M28-CT-15]|uniref:hypothetical protein n=1 Tax=Krasilnikovia sp. M28-CT-15 TaxID=3373540 RepID=UPI0038772E88
MVLFTGGVWLDSISGGPYKVAGRVLAALRDRDAAAVYDVLCAPTKEQHSRESVEQRIAEIPRFTTWKKNGGDSRRSHKRPDGFFHHFVTYTLYDGRTVVDSIGLDLADVDDGVFTQDWTLCGAPLT